MRSFANSCAVIAVTILVPVVSLPALDVDKKFHNAPESAQKMKNPYEGSDAAAQAGKPLYAKNCLSCHGKLGKGTGNVPSLVALVGIPAGKPTLENRHVRDISFAGHECGTRNRSRAARQEHFKVESTTADVPVYRLPLRDARHCPQNHGE